MSNIGNKNEIYWHLIALKAFKMGSDGCTAVSEWNQRCCLQHDVHYRTGHRWKLRWSNFQGTPIWRLEQAQCLTRKEADATFYECNKHHSPGRIGRTRAKLRHWGVRIMPFAWLAWRRYRKADGIQCPGGK